MVRNSDGTKSNSKRKAEFPPLASKFEAKVGVLKKVIYELATLCDIPACLAIRTPEIEPYRNLPRTYTWPESGDEYRRVVDLYKSKTGKIGSRDIRSSDRDSLSEEANRRRMIGGRGDQSLDLDALLKEMEPGSELDSFKEKLKSVARDELVKLLNEVDEKIKVVDEKIEAAKVGGNGNRRKMDEIGNGGGEEPSQADERSKKLKADLTKDLLTDVDEMLESLRGQINSKDTVGNVTRGIIDLNELPPPSMG